VADVPKHGTADIDHDRTLAAPRFYVYAIRVPLTNNEKIGVSGTRRDLGARMQAGVTGNELVGALNFQPLCWGNRYQ